MPTPYHVRLAVSQYGEQFRAELFTEDLGDTEGDLLSELPPSIAEWVPYLAQGADLPPDAARQLGKDLFATLLGHPENAKKWAEVLSRADRNAQSVRILIDATTDAVRDLPYGLLCEPHDDWFLFRGGKKTSVEFVRILRRCSPRPLKLRDRLRVLLAVAEPKSADVPPFDAPLRLQKLAAALHKDVDLVVCGPNGAHPLSDLVPNPESAEPAAFEPYTHATRDALRTALAGDYDVVHLLAHGHGAGVLLCAGDGTPAETTASELAEWCGAGKSSLAFLQVCKAGQTAGRGGFGGVAQQLLSPRGGNLAAVVASTFPLDAGHSTDAALGFYRQLAAGKAPEHALVADRAEGDWCWAFLELWARPGALGGTDPRAAFQFVSPYRGLSSFGEQDADLFFGCKAEVAELLEIVRTEPAVAVVGDSGSGKTSLLQAGLAHAVRREGLAGSDAWRIVSLRPGYRPALALLAALTGTNTEPTPESLATALRADARPLLLVFDQFEEVFTLARDATEVQTFTAALADAVDRQRDRFRLVIGMRSEFLGQAASVNGLSRLIRRPWVLRPPGAGDVRAIVAGPAEHCGYTFQGPLADGEPRHAVALLDRILADPLLAPDQAGGAAAPLPLLQFALERLWLRAVEKGATEFSHAMFDEIGGMGQAVAQHAEAVFQAAPTATALGAVGRGLAEHVITGLVSARGTRQPRSREALQAETGSPDAARTVVDYLVGERLLTIRSDPEDMTKSLLDLSHEVLITNWDRLRGWLAEDPQGRAMREAFRKAAEQWESGFAGVQPRSRYGLPGSDVATNYLAWIDTSRPRLGPVQQEFAGAMRDMLARLRRRRQLVMGALAGLALAACALALYANVQAGRARASAANAITSAGEARESEARAVTNEERALEEKRIATRAKRDADERAALLALEKGVQISEQGQPRLGILAMAYSLEICPPDAADLRRVILTNLASWAPHLLCLDDVRTFPGPALATDRSGKYVLVELQPTGDAAAGPVQLFDADGVAPVGVPVHTPYRVTRATVLPTGVALLAGPTTASAWNASVWDMKTGTQVGKSLHFDTGTAALALSPDAKLVATSDPNHTARGYAVRVYDVATGAPRSAAGMLHQGRVFDLAFSADGKYLATGCGRSSSAQVGDPEKREGIIHLYEVGSWSQGHRMVWRHAMPVAVTCVEISPENPTDPRKTRVVGGGFELASLALLPKKGPDGKDTAEGTVLDTRYSPESTVRIAFRPGDGTEFIACNPSGGLQILHKGEAIRFSGEQLSPQGRVTGAGYRADGRIFTANSDGTVRIWQRPHRGQEEVARGRVFRPKNSEGVLCVTFSPDSKRIALGSKNGIVFVYDLATNGPPKEFRCVYDPKEERQRVTDVWFSSDGRRVVAQDEYLSVFVFDADGNGAPIQGRQRPVGVAPDGKTAVVFGPGEHGYQLTEVGSPALPSGPIIAPGVAAPGGHDPTTDDYQLRASRVAFTPGAAVLAAVDRSGAVYLYRTADGSTIAGPLTHPGEGGVDPIRALEFSPGGETLLTRSARALGLWDARNGALIRRLHNRIGVQSARFGPLGQRVLGGTNFSTAQVWDATGRDVTPVPLLHGAQVWGVGANPAETQVATASFDRTARLWDVNLGKPLTPPLLHDHGVSDACYSPDGKLVLTGSWDGTARLWAVPEPLPDDPARIKAWVETTTGLRVGLNVNGDLLTAKEWHERQYALKERGGSPLTKAP